MYIEVSGKWRFVFDDGPPIEIPNGATYEGLNYLLNVGFRGGSQVSWFVGYIDPAFAGVSPNDTFSSHPGWIETWLGFGPGRRASWLGGSAAGGVLTGNNQHLDISGVGPTTIQGVFLTSSGSNSLTGIIFSTAVMVTPVFFELADYQYGIRLTPRS